MIRLVASLTAITFFCMPAVAQDKAQIQKLQEAFAKAYNDKNAAALADMYTQEAYLLPNNLEMVHGQSGIRGFWEKGVQGGSGLKLTVVNAEPLGSDAVLDIGTFTNNEGPNAQPVEGKYAVLWRKTGNDWKIAADIYNRTKPPLR